MPSPKMPKLDPTVPGFNDLKQVNVRLHSGWYEYFRALCEAQGLDCNEIHRLLIQGYCLGHYQVVKFGT